MSRPAPNVSALVNGMEGWDAVLRDLLTAVLFNPLPVAEYANFAALPDPTAFDRCMATTADDDKLFWSKGGAWKEITVAV